MRNFLVLHPHLCIYAYACKDKDPQNTNIQKYMPSFFFFFWLLIKAWLCISSGILFLDWPKFRPEEFHHLNKHPLIIPIFNFSDKRSSTHDEWLIRKNFNSFIISGVTRERSEPTGPAGVLEEQEIFFYNVKLIFFCLLSFELVMIYNRI